MLLTHEQIAALQAQGAAEKRQVEQATKAPSLAQRSQQEAALYDPASGQLVQLDPTAAAKAVESGAAMPQADALVNVVGPNGEKGAVKGADLQDALRKGYRLESAREKRVNDYLDENAGIGGALAVGAGKALSEAALGLPEIIAEHTADPESLAKWEALKEQHQVASGIGAGLGFGASLFVGGPLFQGASKAGKAAEAGILGARAAEAGLGRKVLASAARMGTEGAVISAPQVVTEAALGDAKAAGEHLAWGLGGGAALGAAGKIASVGLKGLGKLAEGTLEHFGVEPHAANPLGQLSESQAFRSLMHSQDEKGTKLAQQIPGGPKALGRYVLDNDLLRNVNESFESYAARIAERKNAVGEQIGALYKELEAAGVTGASAEDLASRLQHEIIDPLKRKSTRSTEVARLEAYKRDFLQAARIQREGRGLAQDEGHSLYDLWETRKDLDAKVYQEHKAALGNPNPIDKEFIKFRGMIDDAIDQGLKGRPARTVEHALPGAPEAALDLHAPKGLKLDQDIDALMAKGRQAEMAPPDVSAFAAPREIRATTPAREGWKADIEKLNRDFRHIATIEDIVETSVRRQLKNRNLSLSDYLSGGHAGVGIAAALHSPLAGLTAWGVSAGHKFMRENGNVLVAKYADQLGTYFAHQAVAAGEQEFARIPKLLESLPSAESAALNSFHLFLGPGSERKSDEANFKDVSDRLTAIAADPTKAQQHVTAVADTIAKGAPQVAQAYAQAELRRATWLASQLPKPPPPAPFQPDNWKPTPRQVKEFRDKLAVALDPHVIVSEAARGAITPAHVAAAKACWPASYDRIVQETKLWGMTPAAKKLPYQKRLAISLLLQAPADPSLANIGTFQANFTAEAPQGPKPSKLGKLPGSEYTTQQRIRA